MLRKISYKIIKTIILSHYNITNLYQWLLTNPWKNKNFKTIDVRLHYERIPGHFISFFYKRMI